MAVVVDEVRMGVGGGDGNGGGLGGDGGIAVGAR